jgi:hypothetical protein
MAHCLLQAPTVEITRILQRDIVVWLSEVSEARASSWFNDTWTCERGNYTNDTAGYKGNHLSSGIKSPWRYMRHYTVGCAGATQRISLEVFAPSLSQYISIRTKNTLIRSYANSGAHIFPSEAVYIPSKAWKKIQDFTHTSLLINSVFQT